MKFASIQEFRDKTRLFMESQEPVVITNRGRPAGLYFSFDSDSIPFELRKEFLLEISGRIKEQLDEKGVTEEEVLADFKQFRKSRR